MVVLKITDVVRTSELVYYMDEFDAKAVCNLFGNEQTARIRFRIENTATGKKHLTVQLLDKVDYPLLQLQIELKQLIQELIDNDALPW